MCIYNIFDEPEHRVIGFYSIPQVDMCKIHKRTQEFKYFFFFVENSSDHGKIIYLISAVINIMREYINCNLISYFHYG